MNRRDQLPQWALAELRRVRWMQPTDDVFIGTPRNRRQRRMQAHFERALAKKNRE